MLRTKETISADALKVAAKEIRTKVARIVSLAAPASFLFLTIKKVIAITIGTILYGEL
jgi:hypothetical protein